MIKKLLSGWPLLVIILVAAVFASPYIFKGLVPFPANHLVTAFPPWQYYYGMPVKNNAMPDVVTQMYPWKHLVINLWKARQIPLWNPNNFSGSPFLANFQSAVFHPLNFLFFITKYQTLFILPEIDAWSIMILLQPLLAGIFTYLFCRELRINKTPSVLCAISFMFCGFITVWMAYGTLGYAILWLPLVLYGIEKSFNRINFYSPLLISLPIAASFFSGHFQISFYVFIASSFFLIFKLLLTHNVKKFLFSSFFLGIGILLTALQLLPTVELHQLSVRPMFGVSEVVPWQHLLTLIAPDFYGNPVTRNDWFGHYAEWSGFFGVIPLTLVFWSLFKRKKPLVWFFAFLCLGSLVLTRSTFLIDLLGRSGIPVLSTSSASRILSLFAFSGAVLSAFQFEQLIREWSKKKNLKKYLFLIIVSAIIIFGIWIFLLVVHPFPPDKIYIAKRNFILPTAIFSTFCLLVVFGFFSGTTIRRVLPFIILVLTGFDLLRFSSKWMPFDAPKHVYPSVPVLEYLEKKVAPDRLFGYFGMEMQNYYQIPGFQGYDPLYILRYGELLMAADDGKIKIPSNRGVGLKRREKYTIPLLNLMGGKYVLHAIADDRYLWTFPFWEYPDQFEQIYKDDKYEVYENKKAFPRAFLVYDYQVEKERQKAIDTMLSEKFDLAKTIVLEEQPLDKPQKPKNQRDIGRAEIVRYSPREIDIEITNPSVGFLFLSDNYYPGWKAFIDGKDTKIYRADYTFRAVFVPEGKHRLKFFYDPLSFKVGLKITLFSALVLIVSIVLIFLTKITKKAELDLPVK